MPFESDTAITRHLAAFLGAHGEDANSPARPTHVLFNGGVFKSGSFRQRVLDVLGSWHGSAAPHALDANQDLDHAVARGAAYYGLAKQGKGVRIRGGTARSYYVGIETAGLAIPGATRPLRALCVVPFGMEEGSEADVPGPEFGLIVGEPVEFRFLSSTVRRHDPIGTLVEDYEGEIEESSPLSVQLEDPAQKGRTVPVRLHSKVTEIGTLELWCLSRDGKEKWKLEFNVRERPE